MSKGGVDMKRFKILHCWEHPYSDHHILRAQSLASHIRNYEQTQFGKVEVKKKVSATDYASRRGLVFFMDFWYRGNETYPSGDHIDLWDKNKMCSGSPSYFEDSKEVWFWDIV